MTDGRTMRRAPNLRETVALRCWVSMGNRWSSVLQHISTSRRHVQEHMYVLPWPLVQCECPLADDSSSKCPAALTHNAFGLEPDMCRTGPRLTRGAAPCHKPPPTETRRPAERRCSRRTRPASILRSSGLLCWRHEGVPGPDHRGCRMIGGSCGPPAVWTLSCCPVLVRRRDPGRQKRERRARCSCTQRGTPGLPRRDIHPSFLNTLRRRHTALPKT